MSAKAKASAEANEDGAIDSTYSQFLTFWLADEVYGININAIKEITEYGNVTFVPTMPSFIKGVMNLRGSVVPVINLAIRFGAKPSEVTKKTSVVVLEIEHEGMKMEVGVMVDKVNEVIDIAENHIEPPPAFGAKIRTDFITGMGKINDRLLVLIDVGRVLSISELSMVTQAAGPIDEGKDPASNGVAG
jgi:purine-binding chemotaxis protein CheW